MSIPRTNAKPPEQTQSPPNENFLATVLPRPQYSCYKTANRAPHMTVVPKLF